MDTTRYRRSDDPLIDEPAGSPVAADRVETVIRDDPTADPAYRAAAAGAPVVPHAFSVGATFLGWAVASFFSFVFILLLSLIVGGIAVSTNGTADIGEAQTLSLAFLIGAGIAVFLAYMIGGYAAGRMALVNGVAHGAGVVAWSLLFTILSFLLATTAGGLGVVVSGIDVGALTAASIATMIVSFILALAGAMMGGPIGTRYLEARGVGYERERRVFRRGRPL
jgi:hypothetical protein